MPSPSAMAHMASGFWRATPSGLSGATGIAQKRAQSSADVTSTGSDKGSSSRGSPAEPGEGLGLHRLPRDGRLGVRAVGGQPAVHFLPLALRQWGALDLRGNAVPDLLDQAKALLDTEPVDP